MKRRRERTRPQRFDPYPNPRTLPPRPREPKPDYQDPRHREFLVKLIDYLTGLIQDEFNLPFLPDFPRDHPHKIRGQPPDPPGQNYLNGAPLQPKTDPTSESARIDEMARLWRSLSPEVQIAVRLDEIGQSQREVAELYGIPRSTLRRRAEKGRKLLAGRRIL